MKTKSLFDGVISQCVDSNGKCRIVNYKNISLSVVLPVLNVQHISDFPEGNQQPPVSEIHESRVLYSDMKTAKNFMESRRLEPIAQQGDAVTKTVTGIWVKSKEFKRLTPLFIPLKPGSIADERIQISEEILDPSLAGEKFSSLQIMRRNSKIASYLQQYVIYEWAKDPHNFGKDNFVIDAHHEYVPIVNHSFGYNNTFFRKNGSKRSPNISKKTGGKRKKQKSDKNINNFKIIVPNENTRDRLLTHVRVASLNDSTLASQYKDKKVMDGNVVYKNISDFRRSEKCLLFMGAQSVMRWKRENEKLNTKYTVSISVQPDSTIPYYYRNHLIEGGRLMIIQNTVFKDFPAALAVSGQWVKNKINEGYEPQPGTIDIPDHPAYKIYTVKGLSGESEVKVNVAHNIYELNTFNYADGSFGAILFL